LLNRIIIIKSHTNQFLKKKQKKLLRFL